MRIKTVIIIVIILKFNIITHYENTGGSNSVNFETLVENRTLEIIFIGVNQNNVSNSYLYNLLNRTFHSEFPLGAHLSYLNIDIKITFASLTQRDKFTSGVFSYSQLINDSGYYIKYSDFETIVTENFVPQVSDFATYKLYIISFCYENSPFGISNVYINYSQNDIDTQKPSSIMQFAENGISFELKNDPFLGFITSSEPTFEYSGYPLIQELINHEISSYQWNQRLGVIIEQMVWCRLNPSPIYRYNSYKTINVHLTLIGMDDEYSIYDMLGYLNNSYIKHMLQNLLMITELQITTVVTQADDGLKQLTSSKDSSFYKWSDKVEIYLKKNSQKFWDSSYYVTQGEYYDVLNLYSCILIGDNKYLPWSDKHLGLSFSSENDSEFGGMTIETMNYGNIFLKNEGLTRTVIHEFGHLFGLIHPHDFWQPETDELEYSWVWSYTTSPMTYIVSGYDWDYFDYQSVWRLQIFSLVESMSEYDYEEARLTELFEEIKFGSFSSLTQILNKTIQIYDDYDSHRNFHVLFTNFILPSTLLFLFTIVVIAFSTRIRKAS